jgi:hypothetical protein
VQRRLFCDYQYSITIYFLIFIAADQGRIAGAKNCIDVTNLRATSFPWYENRYLPGATNNQIEHNNLIGTIAKIGNLGWYEFERKA